MNMQSVFHLHLECHLLLSGRDEVASAQVWTSQATELSMLTHKAILTNHRRCSACIQIVFVLQPVMLFNPGKISSTSRLLFERGIAMVVVGFPATPLLSARARICISASHSREDLDWALQVSSLPLAACWLAPCCLHSLQSLSLLT